MTNILHSVIVDDLGMENENKAEGKSDEKNEYKEVPSLELNRSGFIFSLAQ
jgi:hypothetical protein